ncbi:MAG: hypothetical protein DI598_20820 [Pseudopedobacter saltans]|uniref:Uncharacterized protein n=1 Tax=Pseudopedobacter saltans TaxID=151895 RepID=A0A2W5G4S8_9SPHI|nr:MAG: hypothetical protein DI598_20820 [Pseudopedobacter saltans]
MANLFLYFTKAEIETRKRIKLSVAAYAYEYESDSIMSDAEFDALAKTVDLSIDTSRPDIDEFFRTHFHTDTGMWIGSHPQLGRIAEIYHAHYASQRR